MNRRGAVLLYVLVTGVLVSVVAAGVLRMTMMNYTATARANAATQNRKEADAMLYQAITFWNDPAHPICSNIDGLFNCIPAAGGCYCPNSSAVPRIEVTGGAPPYKVTLISSDSP